MSRHAVEAFFVRLLLGALPFAPALPAGADMTPAEAFSQGKTFGGTQAGDIGAQVNDGTAQGKMPEYHNSAPAETLFQGGNGALFGPGQTRKDFCATSGGPLPDREKYDCDAVNLLSNMNTARGALQINRQSDPLLNDPNLKAARTNPDVILGTAPTQSGSACVTRQVSDPGTTRIELCNQAFSLESVSCQKILTVAVTVTNTCTPGLWFADNYTGVPWADWWAGDGWTAQPLCELRADNLQLWRYGSLVNLGRDCAPSTALRQTYLDMSAIDALPVLADSSLFPDFHKFDNRCGGPFKVYYKRNGCVPAGQINTCSASWFFNYAGFGSDPDPFTHTYGACPTGEFAGDALSYQATTCDPIDPSLCTTSSITLDAASCYSGPSACGGFLRAPCTAPATYACNAASGTQCGGYTPDTTPRLITGWAIADTNATQSVTVSYVRPGQTFATTDTWDNQCAAYEARQ